MNSLRNVPIRLRSAAIGVGTVGLLLVAWEVFVRILAPPAIPPPLACLRAAIELFAAGSFFEAIVASSRRILVGFTCASILGIGAGFLGGLSRNVAYALSAPVELLRPIPPIAWIPLAIALFGIHDPSAYFVIFVGAFFPIFSNTELGVREVPRRLLDSARVLGATRWRRHIDVVWPAALPSIFTGLRVGLGVAMMCVIAAEMVAARSGLGYLIEINRQLLRLDRVVAGMASIGVLGFALALLLRSMEKYSMPWRSTRHVWLCRAVRSSPAERRAQKRNAERHLNTFGDRYGCELSVRGLTYSYEPAKPVLKEVNFHVERGSCLAVVGPSGCGKTTLLRLLAGLERPHSGEVFLDETALAEHPEHVTMVFQDLGLFPWRTVMGNVTYGLERLMVPKQERRERGAAFVGLVSLTEKASSFPHQLSGGQQQRVAVARALVIHPRLLLMDEPFSGLDDPTREELQEDTRRLLLKTGTTVVWVTHDVREAIYMADKVVIMPHTAIGDLRELRLDIPREQREHFRETAQFHELTANLARMIRGQSKPSSTA
jgi:ABC-type nitrate/sulfonate/bicarbonate transport system ATPase subunit/ABC-type nitrate/sulfonate/bicarbonate transport system permease component